jgi:uncharacterized repeat protein (TIGR03803 family)
MRVKHLALALTVILLGMVAAQAQGTFTTLYNFTGGSDGGTPVAGVIQDSAGDLYGTASLGGFIDDGYNYNCGVVFEMTTAGTETLPYTFCPYGEYDGGAVPRAPVILDQAGNIYGTTWYGGSVGYGAVFKIDTAGNETALYSFEGQNDGWYPEQGLAMDNAGNLYGTASDIGGSSDDGTIFKVDSAGNFTDLHDFAGGPSGANPQYGRMTMDAAGNLYGVTQYGGAYGQGLLYKFSNSGAFTVLHNFKGGTRDGCRPYGSVALDEQGNFYGTTSYCGSNNAGTIWKVSKKGKETILHNFAGAPKDGCFPYGGVARDSDGNLYGATYSCGSHSYYGALYELSASGKLTLLHSFDHSDGEYPVGEVLRTAQGTLFGTTRDGGTDSHGTVWSYVP